MNFQQASLASMAWKPDVMTVIGWGDDLGLGGNKTSPARAVTVPSNSIGKLTVDFISSNIVQLAYKIGTAGFVNMGSAGGSGQVTISVTNGQNLSFRATNGDPGDGCSVSVSDTILNSTIGSWTCTFATTP